MTIGDRVVRDREARRALIVATARELAEKEGWDAVTTRRLSNEIEYSQPVLYKHFSSMEDIVAAVALEGFHELSEVLGAARRNAAEPLEVLRNVAHSYGAYAAENPALYDAMFTRTSPLRFGGGTSVAPLAAAFGALRDAVAAALHEEDVDTATEVLWAALHGLTTLGRNGRLRHDLEMARIDFLVGQFVVAHSRGPVIATASAPHPAT
ncbi:MAG TPA: TetR/AcrR family transcriptional regulator [Nakamurella sp.]